MQEFKGKDKPGAFTRLVNWINMLYPFKKEDDTGRETRFKSFLQKAKKEGSTGVVRVVELCDEALDIISDRLALLNRQKDVDERLQELECYAKLTEEELLNLKDMLASYNSLSKDSTALKYQVTGFDRNLEHLEKLEDAAHKEIPEIKFAEERQRLFKQDINYLQGERVVLEHERDRLKNAIDFVYKFTVAMVVFFAVMALLMVFLYVFRNIQTMLILSSMLAIVIVISAMLYSLRSRLGYELKLNQKKQGRAVSLLNKKLTVYAHFTNYLNYEYKKFRVRSSDMLANNMSDFSHYKHLTKRLDSLRNIMRQTEENISFFLKDKGIGTNFGSIEKFAQTLDLDDKVYFYQEMLREKNTIENSLKRLDIRNGHIWDELMSIKDSHVSDEAVIEGIIEEYMDKANKILENDMNEGTTREDELEEDETQFSSE